MMTVRSLVLVALAGALFLGHMNESYAITTCSVCADEAHPCSFPCFIPSPTGSNQTVTTCKGAGYKCFRVFQLSDDACDAQASSMAATDAIGSDVIELATLAAAWLRDGIALVTGVIDHVASLESGASVRLAHS
ncbi:MAG: hypothetical protein ACREBE_02100 [bacterium]